jgi:hypothetical protein
MTRSRCGEPSRVLGVEGVKVFVWDYNIIRRYWEALELGEKMQM